MLTDNLIFNFEYIWYMTVLSKYSKLNIKCFKNTYIYICKKNSLIDITFLAANNDGAEHRS